MHIFKGPLGMSSLLSQSFIDTEHGPCLSTGVLHVRRPKKEGSIKNKEEKVLPKHWPFILNLVYGDVTNW